jgi:hypothetical protein
MTVGGEVYPLPQLMVSPVTMPPETVAIAVASLPIPPGADIVTEGADEYPLPPFVMVKELTTPLEIVAVAVACVPPPPGAAIVTVGADA